MKGDKDAKKVLDEIESELTPKGCKKEARQWIEDFGKKKESIQPEYLQQC